ncbi:hypothetical protein SAMN02982989_2187 [Xaviernesmea oryzae]|mgnify:CR=1 FL=1|uniref:Uncharacterized protein n=1 Tax=Xaviernesmea oryzae TaxID=464029 RepID=A0A1X7F242_9HYPH|nr:hypothetical protein SAMN02982989_2187 [Xaviernesmea oryzae]
MSIRQALRKQSILASKNRGKETNRWHGSNAILAMMGIVFAIILAVKILHG